MKYSEIREWFNVNLGLFTGVIAFFSALPFISKYFPLPTFLESVFNWLNQTIPTPLYLLFIILVLFLLYIPRILKMYKNQEKKYNLLVGRWQITYDGTIDGQHHTYSEIGEFTKNKQYLDNNGKLSFDISDFNYIELSNIKFITFTKVDLQTKNTRNNLVNILIKDSDNKMTGIELNSTTNVKMVYIKKS